jgi:hypothetical protein
VSSDTGQTIEALYSEIDLSPGEFEHPHWNHAQAISITRYWSGEEAPTSRHAEGRIIWSDESVIARFVCNQIEPLIVSPNPQLAHKTIGLWDRDVCEIFIAPNPARPNYYYEFEAAPNGEWVDLAINLGPTERQTDEEFQSGMTTAARVHESKLTITIRIPWSEGIGKPTAGDEWRVNLFRCIGTGRDRYLAWLPTYTSEPNFHVPEAFGWLRFS